ncbi:MAG: hypothetical protein ACI9OD_000837 [Limisphaerales bacterium]|jgi:hypothetical protein
MLINRRIIITTCATLLMALSPQSQLLAAGKKKAAPFKIGACDWSLKMSLSVESFQFGQRNGLTGIQYSFDAAGKGLDLRLRKNRDTIRKVVKETGVGISSLGIGLLNKVLIASWWNALRPWSSSRKRPPR